MKYLLIINIILTMADKLADLIKQYEAPGNGERKKNLVMELAEVAFEALLMKYPKIDISWNLLKGLIGRIIDIIVKFYNATGVFKKGE